MKKPTIWIKSVTSKTDSSAYMNKEGVFTLRVPTGIKGTAMKPKIGDYIILYQKIGGKQFFTHIVTPINNKERSDGDRPNYKYGREVRIMAKSLIARNDTFWKRVNFQGIGHGNFCKVKNIKNISDVRLLFEQLMMLFQIEEELTSISSAVNEFVEGRKILVEHFVRERDRSLVKQKKNEALMNGSYFCEVCSFSFQKTFSKDFIECHHIEPISEKPVNGSITELSDLALVCSNCHRMLHQKFDGKFLSVEELRNRYF